MIWIIFIAIVFGLLALDLGVFHKKDKPVNIKESLAWTGIWVALALSFGGVIYYLYDTNLFGLNKLHTSPKEAMLQYFTGYIIEESLSMDNIFVIAMIFSFFSGSAFFSPAKYALRVRGAYAAGDRAAGTGHNGDRDIRLQRLNRRGFQAGFRWSPLY